MKDFNAGKYVKIDDYQAFTPNTINRCYRFENAELMQLNETANLKLGELKAYSELVPDIDHFIMLHVVKEATLSSKIEGTKTNMEEAMLSEMNIAFERRDDWKEVQNYIQAMNESINMLRTLPLSTRLLRNAHGILLQGVRGEHKNPGEYRKSQNWIGGSTIKTAMFVPPPGYEVERLMSDLEKFLHNEKTGLSHLIKIAIAHYQFETIHPFLDGNGRIGRLMIVLYLISDGLINKPALYLSEYFETNRALYYDYLNRTRTAQDLHGWLAFFLIGVSQTCQKAIDGIKNILELKKICESELLPNLGKKLLSGQKLLNYLFSKPVVTPADVSEITSLSLVSAYGLINDFQKLGILEEMTGKNWKRVYKFGAYLRIFE